MRSGPLGKGPRLWLEPGRERNGRKQPAVWTIRDGPLKRSTRCGAEKIAEAEQHLANYIADKYRPDRRRTEPSQVLIADVLGLYVDDVVPSHARPDPAKARIRRLVGWWADPDAASRDMIARGITPPELSGTASDIRTATCHAYLSFVGAPRSARMDLELLRAALNHAHREQLIDRPVPVALPPKSLPRERWLTRDEVAKLVWAAWRFRRTQTYGDDDWGSRKHVARWILIAAYTGTRKSAILNASFQRKAGRGYIDLDQGLWERRGQGVRATKKRQPPIPLPVPLLGHMRRWKKNGPDFRGRITRSPGGQDGSGL